MSSHTSLLTQLDELKAATQAAATVMGPDNVALADYANVLKWIVSKDTDEAGHAWTLRCRARKYSLHNNHDHKPSSEQNGVEVSAEQKQRQKQKQINSKGECLRHSHGVGGVVV